MCLSVAVANVEQPKNEIELNVQLAANFLASLLKKNWQNIKVCSYLAPGSASVARVALLCSVRTYGVVTPPKSIILHPSIGNFPLTACPFFLVFLFASPPR